MKCEIIRDLLPLYIDDCCSDENKVEIEKHLCVCEKCKLEMKAMNSNILSTDTAYDGNMTFKRIKEWKASLLQTLLMLVSFLCLVFGVAKEASTPSGILNGVWAFSVIVPITGFLLSLTNWYFLRIYKKNKIFSNCSMAITFVITLCLYGWCLWHYASNLSNLLDMNILYFAIGIALTVVLCIASKLFSHIYGKMSGKD